MELLLTVFPLKTCIFAAGFGGIFTILKTKYKNFKLGKELDKNLKEIKKSYFHSIKEDLKNKKDIYIKENLADFDPRKLEKAIKEVFKEEKMYGLTEIKVKEFIDQMKFETHTSYFNILVIGSTGVGKSTLINSVLKLEENSENYAKTGYGEPVTLGEPKFYISEKVKGLKLWDSQGIDKSGYNIGELKKSVTNLINTNAENNNPDNFIHCIWYCVSGHRFEQIERDFLIELMKIYHDETLPIIIAYTQCKTEEDGEKMKKEIEKICKEQNREIEIILVLAKDAKVGRKENPTIVPSYGIDNLLKSSFGKIEGAVKSACFHSIREQIKNNYKASIKKNQQKIKDAVKGHLSSFNISIPLKELKNKILKIFEIIIKILIFDGDETKTLSEKSKSNLLNFLDEYTQTCADKLNNFMKQKVIEKSIELAQTYLSNQENIKQKSNKINDGFFLNLSNSIIENISILDNIGVNTGSKDIKNKYKELEEWKKISEEELSNEFNQKIEAFFNIGITKFILEEFLKILTECLINSFNDTFNNIDDYMVEKTGAQVKVISENIIKQIKEQ